MPRYLIYLLILFAPVAHGSEWQLIRDESGIQLHTQAVAGSDIARVKASVVVNVDLDTMSKALDDTRHYLSWVPYLQETRLLTPMSDDGFLVYNYFDAPWPARDRDFVYQVKIVRNEGQVSYVMRSVASDLMPPIDRAVRAELIESQYVLKAINTRQTYMEILYHANPKGRLPLWIINIVNQRIPFDALEKLRDQMARASSE